VVDGHARKEAAIDALLRRLSVIDSRALIARIERRAASDAFVAGFSTLARDRRSRLLATLRGAAWRASQAGGGASQVGGSASQVGGSASQVGGGASQVGDGASQVGGSASQVGGGASQVGGAGTSATALRSEQTIAEPEPPSDTSM
jgi:hypothetical protein